jgi:hypothetical protein
MIVEVAYDSSHWTHKREGRMEVISMRGPIESRIVTTQQCVIVEA